ncbi:uncharacterized protein LALA0_S08e04456g [Lachancea lanzarotensis]|uniref:LALA0S08e04456g1_1 n=1 Tax=Lachancea lanzarotensis TaxID=1245769 RepID=A0A0C7MUK7_9SACH|nr:uncharacterized protein LALA0_S08e04456g [Lachancea lanzarotensis]CEP63524.1 LALA0S08e04456g1_1 [Lachancea lanzarotensis]
MDATEEDEPYDRPTNDRTIDSVNSDSRMMEIESADSSQMENSTTILEQSSNTTADKSRDGKQPYQQNYHKLIIPEELSTVRFPKRASAKLVQAIQQEIRKNDYKTSDDGKEFRFRWDNTATYFLAKYCCEIGPFLGFENLQPEPSFKLETSTLISLKWSCVLYNLLMSVKFKGNTVPTELQLKTRVKYLVDNANLKILAVTNGDKRNPCTLTGDDKTDELVNDLARLKNAADKRRTEIQTLVTQRQSNKRDVGSALCNYALPEVVQNAGSPESEKSSPATDDVNAIDVPTNAKRRRVNPAAAALFTDLENSIHVLRSEMQQDRSSLLESLRTMLDGIKQGEQEKIALEKERIALEKEKMAQNIALEREKIVQNMALEREKIAQNIALEKEKIAQNTALEREKIALENGKIKSSQMASMMTAYLQYNEKFESSNPDLAKFIDDQWRSFQEKNILP